MTLGTGPPGSLEGSTGSRGSARAPRFGLAAIAVTLVVAGLVVWVSSQRISQDRDARAAFPMVSGQLRVEGLFERLEIARDARGIPHVLATNESDAWFGLGFAHAQDRLGQMVWLRRLAQGRTAEWIGESGLASDRLARTLGFAHLAETRVALLDDDVGTALDAYVRGINARIARIQTGRVAPPVVIGKRLAPVVPAPVEGQPMRAPTPPFSAADIIAVGKLVAWSAGASHERAIVLSDLIERLGSIAARPFFPSEPGEASGSVLALSRELAALSAAAREPRRPGGLPPFTAASLRGTAWAIPGSLSASGSPILVAEMSVPATAPSLLYEAHLRGGSLDVAGATIPGLPVFWVGRNQDLAWAAVPLAVASVDLFKETLRIRESDSATGASLYYQNGSRWVAVEERRETIAMGRTASEVLSVRSTRHGPLVDGLLGGPRSRAPVALAWTGARPGDALTGLMRVAHSRDAAELAAALSAHHEPPIEVVFAERGGGVGLRTAGWLPRRSIPSGLVPVPGRLRAFDWRVPIDPEALPSVIVPRDPTAFALEGTSAGDDPSELAVPSMVSTGTRVDSTLSGVSMEWLWRDARRAARIEERVTELVAGGGVELREAAAVLDDVAANADPELVAALFVLAGEPPLLSAEATEVLDLLRGWDGQAGVDSRGTPAFELLLSHLVPALLADALGEELLDRYLSLPGVRPEAVVRGILVAAARGDTRETWADPARVGAAVRESLRRTWMSLSYRLGHNRERWTWGRLQELSFRPFDTFGTGPVESGFDLAGMLGLSGRFAAAPDEGGTGSSVGPFGLAGRAQSVARAESSRVTFAANRASTYRLAVDLSSRNRLLTTLAPGQSEHPGHAHFSDGVAGWRSNSAVLLVTSAFLLEEAALERLVLEPPR